MGPFVLGKCPLGVRDLEINSGVIRPFDRGSGEWRGRCISDSRLHRLEMYRGASEGNLSSGESGLVEIGHSVILLSTGIIDRGRQCSTSSQNRPHLAVGRLVPHPVGADGSG